MSRTTEENVVQMSAKRRTKQMRAQRLAVKDLKVGKVEVRFHHAGLGELEGIVENLSANGLAAVVPATDKWSSLARMGDRIDDVVVSCRQEVLFKGPGLVRRASESGQELRLGIELGHPGIDLPRLRNSGVSVDFATRWEGLKGEAGYGVLSPQFKVWVADVRAELMSAERFLGDEEQRLHSEDLATRTRSRREYLDVIVPDLRERIVQARETLNVLVGQLSETEHAAYRAYASMHLRPFFSQAPFARRALEKPLGYAGDYEMMNMLYRDPAEGDTLLGQALNVVFTNEPAALANKNRIAYLGELIRRVMKEHPGVVRIASLGSGPAREIEALLTESPELGERLDVALIDQEERAMAHAERALLPLAAKTGAKIKFIREGLRALLTRDALSEKLGKRHLIYSAGLFDYLDDRLFSRVTESLYEALYDGGRLAIGNVASHNPSRWMMEYFSEWFLIHRSPDDLRRLVSDLKPTPSELQVDAEPSGVNLFVHARR